MTDQFEPQPVDLLAFARELRQRHTDSENCSGPSCAIARQHPVDPYVLDFYCAQKRLGIELDGAQHDVPHARCRDERRSAALLKQGIRVVRFPNQEMLADIQSVLKTIWPCSKNPSFPAPLPKGEGSYKTTILTSGR